MLTVNGKVALAIDPAEIKQHVLVLVIPPEELTAVQTQTITMFSTFLESKGVTLLVIPLSF